MSRVSIEGERYTFAFGVDHVTSVFIQVFDKQIENPDDQLLVDASNLGVELYCSDRFTSRQNLVLNEIVDAFEWARKHKNPYPNIDPQRVFNIARAFDIDLTMSRIYEVLD
jgi:hypothetical protein